MTVWQVIIPFAAAVMAVALTAWINVHIKFAETRDAAIGDLKRIAIRVGSRGAIVLNVGFLIQQIFSSAPVTRLTVVLMASQIASLVAVFLMSVIQRVAKRVVIVAEGLAHAADASRHLALVAQASLTSQHAQYDRTREIQVEQLTLIERLVDAIRPKGDPPDKLGNLSTTEQRTDPN